MINVKCEVCSSTCICAIAYFGCNSCNWMYKYNFARLGRHLQYEDLITSHSNCPDCGDGSNHVFEYFTYWCDTCECDYDNIDLTILSSVLTG